MADLDQTRPYHTMGVLPSTQPEATFGSSFIVLPLIWLARVVCLLVGAVEGWVGGGGLLSLVLCCVTLCYVTVLVLGFGLHAVCGHGCTFADLYHAMPYQTIPYNTIQYHTIPYNTIQYHTIPWAPKHAALAE